MTSPEATGEIKQAVLAAAFQGELTAEWRRHESEHETTGMGKKHRGLVAPQPTESLRDESKRSSS